VCFSIFVQVCFLKVPFIILGETYSVEEGWKGKNSCIPLEDYVDEWIGLGAKYIGGCCRSNSDDIRKIKEKVVKLR
jgi:S-methylmethionine-dependent homocysteine/selenocysteine methylase